MQQVTTYPLVTVAIPTYNRPALLRRALECVRSQDYPNIEVLVSDNCSTAGDEVSRVVESFKGAIADIKYTRHDENIGPIRNLFSLLERANGTLFMWLADDDEISANYVSELTRLLVDNPDAVSAAGHWVLMLGEQDRKPMPTTSLPQRSSFLRALSFIWKSDDAFFYGLHRTAVLRQAAFAGYWWPNRGELFNWGYVFLLDMVLRGRVLVPGNASVEFINHDYTVKSYGAQGNRARLIFMYVVRRINVHYLYLVKVRRALGVILVMPLALVSILSLLREFAWYFGGGTCRRLWRFIGGK